MALEVIPASPERYDELVELLGPEGCLCQYWRMSSGDFARARGAERRAALRAQLDEDPATGMLALDGGELVGWVGFGQRQRLERLVRSRTIPAVDELPVWSVYCFTVKVGHRRKGVARALLDGVVAYARERGAPALEAYPVDTGGRRIHGTAAYVGVASTFEAAGFRRVTETAARSDRRPRVLMRLPLDGRPSRGTPG